MIKKRNNPLFNLFLGLLIGVIYGALWYGLFEFMVMADIRPPFDDRLLYLPMFLILVVINAIIGGEKFSVVFRTIISAPVTLYTVIFISVVRLEDALSEM